MKILIILTSYLIGISVLFKKETTTQSAYNNTLQSIQIDSTHDSLYYGLTAQQIINMPVKEVKLFCQKHNIGISQFVVARTNAKTHLLNQEIIRDSIEVVRIYERIDKHLGIDSKN